MRLRVSNEIVEAAIRGEPADIERLLEGVWADAYRLARAVVTQRDAAEDAAQEACVIMFRKIATLRSAAAFGTWFYRIVVREALKQKKALHSTEALQSDVPYEVDRDAVTDLLRALATLPAAQRAAVVLHYFEGLTSIEIADVLRIPNATVRFRLMTARRRLRTLLPEIEPPTEQKGEAYAL